MLSKLIVSEAEYYFSISEILLNIHKVKDILKRVS